MPGAREKEPIWSWATPLQWSHLGDQIAPCSQSQASFHPWGPVLSLPRRPSSCFSWEGFLPVLYQLGTLPTTPTPQPSSQQGGRASMSERGARVRGNLQDVPRSFLRAGGANPLPSLPTCTHSLVE